MLGLLNSILYYLFGCSVCPDFAQWVSFQLPCAFDRSSPRYLFSQLTNGPLTEDSCEWKVRYKLKVTKFIS